jgi:predicted kinase
MVDNEKREVVSSLGSFASDQLGPVGAAHSRLVVLRGNSGSGKTSTALAARKQLGRGTALVQQDYFRRIVLREHDKPGGANIGLISLATRYALEAGYHVIVEGIFHSARYGSMLRSLANDHRGQTFFYYFDISFEETVRRHHTRPESAEFTSELMRTLYTPRDLLDFVDERLVTESSSLDGTVNRVLIEAFDGMGALKD